MELFGQWEDLPMDARASRAPLPHEEFDNYFEAYNEIDNLFNETLTGLQDLDVPSGFMNNNTRKTHQAKHSRQLSGTAIFGFAEHTRELSLGGGILGDLHRPKPSTDLSKYISPGEILNLHQRAGESLPNLAKPIHLAEQDEIEFENQNQKELGETGLPCDEQQSKVLQVSTITTCRYSSSSLQQHSFHKQVLCQILAGNQQQR